MVLRATVHVSRTARIDVISMHGCLLQNTALTHLLSSRHTAMLAAGRHLCIMVSAEVDNLIVEWCFTLSDSDEASIEGTEELIEALVACAGEKRKGSVDMSLVHSQVTCSHPACSSAEACTCFLDLAS